MPRLIDAYALKERIKKKAIDNFTLEDWYGMYIRGLRVCEEAIDEQPSVDAMPVVRCHDCKNYDETTWTCLLHEANVQPRDYCSYGERNDGETYETKPGVQIKI